MTLRCAICDWPIAKSREEGCVPGDCSYRPDPGSPEWSRIQTRRNELAAQRAELALPKKDT